MLAMSDILRFQDFVHWSALFSPSKSYYSDCSSAKFKILALNLKSCTSNIIFDLGEQTRIESAQFCRFYQNRVIWPVDLLFTHPTLEFSIQIEPLSFPLDVDFFLSHRQINWISHQSWVILFLRVTIFWPREKKRNWFHSWPMRRAETCFWKRENKNVSRQRKTWIHDFRLLNVLKR